jgi:hypothetical protein
MKKHIIRIVTALFVIYTFSFTTCYYEEPIWKYEFTNNSDSSIIVNISNFYPDTTPRFEHREQEINDKEHYNKRYVAPNSTNDTILFGIDVPSSTFYWNSDTISCFIIDEKVYNENGLFKVQLYYLVKQRYDLSEDDMKYLDYKLTYPPSPKMRGMKMYPPYEEAIKVK